MIDSDRAEGQRIDAEIHRPEAGSDPFAAAVRATRMPMLITDPRQPDNPIVFVNDAFFRLTGYDRAGTLGRNCRFLQGPGTNQDDVTRIRDSIERQVSIEIELLNYRKDGTTFWNKLLISPVFDSHGQLTYFFASQFDITPHRERVSRLASDRDQLETEIQNRIFDLGSTEERLRFALKAGRLGAWTLDIAHQRLVASAQFRQILGHAAADAFSFSDFEKAILPADRDVWLAAYKRGLETDDYVEADLRVRTGEGDVRWIEIRAQTLKDAEGRAISMAGVVLDITDRRAAEAHRDLLTRELSHRVKNNMATVQAIVAQTLRPAGIDPSLTVTIADRLQALAHAHDVLTAQGWEVAEMADLVTATLRPFNQGDRRIAFGGPKVKLSARAATAIALALHELATNAVKYGALSVASGKVTLNWDQEDGQLVMVWSEAGGPAVTEPERQGFGSKLINQALAGSTFGTVDIKYRPHGLRFEFRAPLETLVEADSTRQY